MTLARRIIPVILCKGRTMVKGIAFDSWRSVGVAAQAVRVHGMRGVDEVCLLDIGATPDGRGPDLDLVKELSEALFVPLTVGGGVRGINDVKALLRAGADKVLIGAAALTNPELIRECASIVGSQAIVAAVDATSNMERGWKTAKGGMPAHEYAQCLVVAGAGEILLTSIEKEGTLQGYDLETIRQVSWACPVPVIAHGGCGSYEHMLQALQAGADAVAAGAMFQFTDQTPDGAARYLAKRGVETRVRA